MRSEPLTPRAARRLLDRVRSTAEHAHLLYRIMERRRSGSVSGDEQVDPLYFALLTRFHRCTANLERLGVRVADPRLGTFDFPASVGGRPIWLCWRVGDAGLDHGHRSGHCGARQPVVLD